MITERDFWNHRSQNYDEQIGPQYEQAYQLTAERTLAYLKPEDRVLDFACGTGYCHPGGGPPREVYPGH